MNLFNKADIHNSGIIQGYKNVLYRIKVGGYNTKDNSLQKELRIKIKELESGKMVIRGTK